MEKSSSLQLSSGTHCQHRSASNVVLKTLNLELLLCKTRMCVTWVDKAQCVYKREWEPTIHKWQPPVPIAYNGFNLHVGNSIHHKINERVVVSCLFWQSSLCGGQGSSQGNHGYCPSLDTASRMANIDLDEFSQPSCRQYSRQFTTKTTTHSSIWFEVQGGYEGTFDEFFFECLNGTLVYGSRAGHVLLYVLWDFRVPKSRNVINKLEWPDEQTILLNKELDCIPRLNLTTWSKLSSSFNPKMSNGREIFNLFASAYQGMPWRSVQPIDRKSVV